ncbi:hypothetical protein [Nocardiopsis xinjiangensis]|uniref:hypothetical protein n=1 Tax=Nocardiopsis xinjiangensis TaxID=124285 RepID=UPI0012693EC2|nr:hypothetical protein [Nocardiopsis xinjiangensis]
MRSFTQKVLIAFTCAAFLPLASGSANADEDPNLLGSSEGDESETQGLIAEANRVERNERGNLVSIDWSIANETDSDVVLNWLHEQGTYTYSGNYYSGVTVVTPEAGTRYHPLMDQAGECVCAGKTSDRFYNQVAAGGKSAYWSLFSTPSDVETLTLEVPGFEPIEDIPIG